MGVVCCSAVQVCRCGALPVLGRDTVRYKGWVECKRGAILKQRLPCSLGDPRLMRRRNPYASRLQARRVLSWHNDNDWDGRVP